MATSSNASTRAAGAAVETGQPGSGGVTESQANVTFEPQVQQQVANEAPAQPVQQSPVEGFVTQAIESSPMASQPVRQQRQQAETVRTATPQAQAPQSARSQASAFMPQSANVRASAAASASAPASSQQPAMQSTARQQAPAAASQAAQQQPSGAIGGAASEQAVGPVMSQNDIQAQQQQTAPRQQSRSRFPDAGQRGRLQQQEDPAMADRRAIYADMSGRDEVRREGVVEKPEPVNKLSHANRRFKRSKKFFQEKIDNVIKRKGSYKGTSFYETIFSKPDLQMNQVSIGDENLLDSLREPNSQLLQIVNDQLAAAGREQLDLQACLDGISLLVDAINSLNIDVTLEKTPVNVNNSIQVRTLRAHYGRGIGLHPTQTKAYNADFDGDPAVLNLDQSNVRSYSRAMTRLIDIEGNATIDPDFFPLDPIEPGQRDDVRQSMREGYFQWNPDIVSLVYDAYEKACNDGDWVGLLRRIDEVAGGFTGYRDDATSRILKSLYDFSTERRGLSLRTQFDSNEEFSNYNPPDANLDPFVYNLVDLVDEIVAGRTAPNFQDFTLFYNKYYGDVRGKKNVPFRLLADFAKAINRTELITIGSDIFGIKPVGTDVNGIAQDAKLDMDSEVTLNQLWQFTCAAGTSKQISGRMHMGSRQLAVSTQVRKMVMRECPIPDYDFNDEANPVDAQFRDWVHRFVESYNRNMRMLSISQVSFRQGMTPVREFKHDGVDERTLEGLDKALVEVFGDKTVETLFPGTVLDYGGRGYKENTGTGVVKKYRNMKVATFSVNNRISFRSERHGTDENGEDISIPRKDVIAEHISRDEFTPMDVLMLVADRRTKQLGDYNEAWLKATEANQKVLARIQEELTAGDFNGYVQDMVELMYFMSPDMFDYYGMDSMATFVNSKWGKKLLDAKSLTGFRSHLMSMTVEYRLNRANKVLAEIDEVNGDSMADVSQLEALDAAFELEMGTLASSSMVWNTIAKEMMEGNRTFLRLIQDKGVKNWRSLASDFWNRDDASKYRTLVTFLKSSEPYEVKAAVLADVTRVRQQYADITVGEVMGQLAHHPDRLHAGSRFDMDSGIRSDIDTLKESADRINSYREKTIENIEKESARILDEARKDTAAFEQRLRRFSDDPGYMVHVDSILAADAIASIYDKAYPDSEKIEQQATVNGYFGAISLQRSGGYYTHLQQTDNAVVNAVGFDQLTVQDIVRILGNSEVELTVYDEFGTPAHASRETLCGGSTIDDVIQYLEANPRIALACRRFVAGVGSDVDGTARMTAINSLEAGDVSTSRVFSLLNDRPRFLAVAALCTPAEGNVGRNLAERVHENLENLCAFVAREVIDGKGMTEVMQDAERYLGVDPETVVRLRSEDSFDGEPSELDYDAAGGLYSEVMGEILDCVDLVRESGVKLSPADIPAVSAMHVDKSSIVSYYDARQQLSGARTATMIGVEGGETKKNLILKEYLRNRPDTYMMSEDGVTVIPVVEGLDPADLTLERDAGKQTNSIGKSLEVKREKGAETFNAKSKKYGDDGTNSIVKFVKMGMRSMFDRFGKPQDSTWSIEDGKDLLERIAECESKFEAVPILAQALIDADSRLGYTDGVQFVESDYWNRADLMLAESVDEEGNTTIVVRTLEQLATAMRNRLSDVAVESGSVETVMAELEQIALTLGTSADPMTTTQREVLHRCFYNVNLHSSIGNRFRIDRAMRQRSSSTERNYALVYKIFQRANQEKGGRGYVPPSRERVNEHSKHMLDKLNDRLRDKVRNLANPNYASGSYDYMGTITDPETKVIPGPQSLVLFTLPPSDKRSVESIERCKTYGMTAAFESIEDVPAEYQGDALWTGQLYILSFFDMELNGSMSSPVMPAPAQFPFNPDNVMTNVEDTTYEFKEGDATYHMTRELADRVRVNFIGDGQVFDAERLFPNVLAAFPESDFQMDFCTNEEIQKYVVNGEFNPSDMTINGFDVATVDIGVIPENDGFDREAGRFAIRLREYQDAFGSSDAEGFLTGDVRYDSIVGFVKIVIDGNAVALAPIWPFHLDESGSVPTTFRVDKVEFDPESHSFNMSWRYSGGLEGQYIKAFEGIGASNKMMSSGDRARSRTLENGLPIDGFYSTKSVASRLFASNKRIHTMASLMLMTRIDKRYAYNFAELPGSFPGDPELPDGRKVKDALLTGTMGITDWVDAQDTIGQYHVDPEVDALVRYWVRKCVKFGTVNPTTLLATKTTEGVMWPTATEFECFMDTGYNFQNAFMKTMNMMCPTLCPPNIDADSSNTLFKPVTGNTSEDYGVLQMLVPHYNVDGEEYRVPENVYLSFGFFGDEFSGFKQVNFDALQRSVDSLNVSSNMNGFDLSQLMAFGRAGMSSVTMGANMIQAVPDNIMQEAGE